MGKELTVNEIAQSLAFEVEAIPRNDVLKLSSSSKTTPLNLKVRVRKKNEATVKQGYLSVYKLNEPGNPPERIRLINSDQTILSFNVLMETDLHKTAQKPRKNLFGVCLATEPEDDVPPYMPSNIDKSSKSEDQLKQNIIIKKNENNDISPMKRQRMFFGKCKPGGCLDPPFNEDKYTYKPKKEIVSPPGSFESKKLSLHQDDKSSSFTNRMFRKRKQSRDSLSIEQKQKEEIVTSSSSILSLYQTDYFKNSLDSKVSSSIITYPPNDYNNKTKNRVSAEERSRKSFNEFTEAYFIPPKNITSGKGSDVENITTKVVKQVYKRTSSQYDDTNSMFDEANPQVVKLQSPDLNILRTKASISRIDSENEEKIDYYSNTAQENMKNRDIEMDKILQNKLTNNGYEQSTMLGSIKNGNIGIDIFSEKETCQENTKLLLSNTDKESLNMTHGNFMNVTPLITTDMVNRIIDIDTFSQKNAQSEQNSIPSLNHSDNELLTKISENRINDLINENTPQIISSKKNCLSELKPTNPQIVKLKSTSLNNLGTETSRIDVENQEQGEYDNVTQENMKNMEIEKKSANKFYKENQNTMFTLTATDEELLNMTAGNRMIITSPIITDMEGQDTDIENFVQKEIYEEQNSIYKLSYRDKELSKTSAGNDISTLLKETVKDNILRETVNKTNSASQMDNKINIQSYKKVASIISPKEIKGSISMNSDMVNTDNRKKLKSTLDKSSNLSISVEKSQFPLNKEMNFEKHVSTSENYKWNSTEKSNYNNSDVNSTNSTTTNKFLISETKVNDVDSMKSKEIYQLQQSALKEGVSEPNMKGIQDADIHMPAIEKSDKVNSDIASNYVYHKLQSNNSIKQTISANNLPITSVVILPDIETTKKREDFDTKLGYNDTVFQYEVLDPNEKTNVSDDKVLIEIQNTKNYAPRYNYSFVDNSTDQKLKVDERDMIENDVSKQTSYIIPTDIQESLLGGKQSESSPTGNIYIGHRNELRLSSEISSNKYFKENSLLNVSIQDSPYKIITNKLRNPSVHSTDNQNRAFNKFYNKEQFTDFIEDNTFGENIINSKDSDDLNLNKTTTEIGKFESISDLLGIDPHDKKQVGSDGVNTNTLKIVSNSFDTDTQSKSDRHDDEALDHNIKNNEYKKDENGNEYMPDENNSTIDTLSLSKSKFDDYHFRSSVMSGLKSDSKTERFYELHPKLLKENNMLVRRLKESLEDSLITSKKSLSSPIERKGLTDEILLRQSMTRLTIKNVKDDDNGSTKVFKTSPVDHEDIFVDFAFESYINDDKYVLKTFDPINDTQSGPRDNDKILIKTKADQKMAIKTKIKPDFSDIRIPMDPTSYISISIKTKENSQSALLSQNLPANGHGRQDNLSKDQVNPNKMDMEVLQNTLSLIYEQQLLPLQSIIKDLRSQVEFLGSQQFCFKDNMPKTRRLKLIRTNSNKRCGCNRKSSFFS